MKNIIIKKIGVVTMLICGSLLTHAQEKNNAPGVDHSNKYKEKTTAKNTKEDVIKWLKTSITANAPVKNKMINNILKTGLFEEMRIEQKNVNDMLLVVPMKEVYFSQHIDKAKPLPLQYLLIVENEKGQIEGGNLMLVYPIDKSLKELPKNAFHNFYYQDEKAVDGTYSFIALYLGDFKSWEIDIKNGRMVQMRGYPSKKVTTSTGTCLEWSFRTTDYNKDGVVKETVKPLGISCTVCPPGYKCDPLSAIKVVSP